MSSQEDLFATQEPRKKGVKYEFVVLCDKDDNVPNPFSLYPITMFSENEIQARWLESKLDDSSRIKSLQTLEGIPDKNLSLFGKIDQGTKIRDNTRFLLPTQKYFSANFFTYGIIYSQFRFKNISPLFFTSGIIYSQFRFNISSLFFTSGIIYSQFRFNISPLFFYILAWRQIPRKFSILFNFDSKYFSAIFLKKTPQ